MPGTFIEIQKYPAPHKVKFTTCDIQLKITRHTKKQENMMHMRKKKKKNNQNQPKNDTDVRIGKQRHENS